MKKRIQYKIRPSNCQVNAFLDNQLHWNNLNNADNIFTAFFFFDELPFRFPFSPWNSKKELNMNC